MNMVRYAGILLVVTLLMTTATQAQQRSIGGRDHEVAGRSMEALRGYRDALPSGLRQFIPGVIVVPGISLFSSAQQAAPVRSGPPPSSAPQGMPMSH
jgi:hypothetical protein